MAIITVDGQQIQAVEGKSLLQTCLENDIYIPNLCFLKDMDEPTGACRLCFVKIEGEDGMVPSCKTKVTDGMVVRTNAPEVREAQRWVFELLFSTHQMSCKNCLSKRHCELQKIAKVLGVRLRGAKPGKGERDTGSGLHHPCLQLNSSKCILCRRCLHVCSKRNKEPILTLVRSHSASTVGLACAYPPPVNCDECLACVAVCPVSAIVPRANEA